MGAVTVSIKKTYYTLGGKNVVADVTFSSTYANPAGDTFTPAQFGLDYVNNIECNTAVGASNVGYAVNADVTNKTLRLYGGAASGVGLAQPTNGGDQSATVARVVAHGNDPNP
jgi:hypothetical protein